MHFYLDVFRDSWLPRDGSFRDGLNDGGSEEFRGRGHAEHCLRAAWAQA